LRHRHRRRGRRYWRELGPERRWSDALFGRLIDRRCLALRIKTEGGVRSRERRRSRCHGRSGRVVRRGHLRRRRERLVRVFARLTNLGAALTGRIELLCSIELLDALLPLGSHTLVERLPTDLASARNVFVGDRLRLLLLQDEHENRDENAERGEERDLF